MQNVIQRAYWPFSNSFLAASGFKDNDPIGLKIFITEIGTECHETSSYTLIRELLQIPFDPCQFLENFKPIPGPILVSMNANPHTISNFRQY